MKKYTDGWLILRDRKAMKKKSHLMIRQHYIVLVALMLVMILFGTEYSYVMTQLTSAGPTFSDLKAMASGSYDPEKIEASQRKGYSLLSADDIVSSIMVGELSKSEELFQRLKEQLSKSANEDPILGTTRGELARVVNAMLSGDLYVKLAQTIFAVTKSKEITGIIFTILSFLFYAAVFCFISNVYSAMIRRPFLYARVYSRVSPFDALHLFVARGYINTVLTMALRYIYQFLWNLTIVGGIIKVHSYFAVPYIIAENPGIEPKEAITLSRKMMDGHKMELFLFRLSYIGWYLLAMVTCGFSDLFYGAAYRMAGEVEFFARVRKAAIHNRVEGAEALDDKYLYVKADRIELTEVYFDAVDEITLILEERVELTGFVKKMSEWFGIWIGTLKDKQKYDELEGRKYAVERLKNCMDGYSYPFRLNPRYHARSGRRNIHFTFLRSYSVWTLILFFIMFSGLGWIWEVALHFMQTGEFANRGTLFGPWLPIYGTGGVIVLILCSRFRKKPALEFFVAIALCGTIEYFAAWYLESRYHTRWWSYDGYFLNLHGRICAEGLLVFGVLCCVIVYLVAPVLDFLLSKIKPRILIIISAILMVLFGADCVYSIGHPNVSRGAVEEDVVQEDAVEEDAVQENAAQADAVQENSVQEDAEQDDAA